MPPQSVPNEPVFTMTPKHPIFQIPTIPGKVQAAFNYLAYCDSVSSSATFQSDSFTGVRPGRKLSQLELGAKNAALNLLRNWFNGEISMELSPTGVFNIADGVEESDDEDGRNENEANETT